MQDVLQKVFASLDCLKSAVLQCTDSTNVSPLIACLLSMWSQVGQQCRMKWYEPVIEYATQQLVGQWHQATIKEVKRLPEGAAPDACTPWETIRLEFPEDLAENGESSQHCWVSPWEIEPLHSSPNRRSATATVRAHFSQTASAASDLLADQGPVQKCCFLSSRLYIQNQSANHATGRIK